ncbi:MAG TPA: hypothetical protein VMV69_22330, partial [Pirellulales bacterium]|nr:hypothetical protein [Pirellulales bacterium]
IAGVDGCREGFGPNGRYFWFLQRNGHSRAEDENFWQEHAGGGPEAGDGSPSATFAASSTGSTGQEECSREETKARCEEEQIAAEFTMENKKTGQTAVENFGTEPSDDHVGRRPPAAAVEMMAALGSVGNALRGVP